MKKFTVFICSLLFLSFASSVQAENLSLTVDVGGSCNYNVCVVVEYSLNGMLYSTTQRCENINVGGSYTFRISTPVGSSTQGVYFNVSAGSFQHTFTSTNSDMVFGNCNSLSNPRTYWDVLASNHFLLEGQNVLGGGKKR